VKRNFVFSWLLITCSCFLLSRCANPVTPQGGKKDVVPPKVTECDPANFSTRFNSREIRITYDEFVQLKDAKTQIMISPPDLQNTDIHLRGKSLLIDFTDKLRPNTTYSIDFGTAISDITEGNIKHDFTYVFSTGTYLDSLMLKGKVLDAFDHKPQKDIFVMLYADENDTLPLDSLPCKVRPYYLTKTSENGEFTFTNIRNIPYLLFALKDQDGDLIYNLPNEKIAFYDSLVKGSYRIPILNDTARKDSTVKKDTTVLPLPPEKSYTLMLFEKTDSNQHLLKSRFVRTGLAELIYRFPLIKPVFVALKPELPGNWNFQELNKTRDTVYLWMNNIKTDTLVLQVSDNGKVIDTTTITRTLKADKKKTGKKDGTGKEFLGVSPNSPDGRINQFAGDPRITFSYPLAYFKPLKAMLIQGKDTIRAKLSFADSIHHQIILSAKWKEETNYRLFAPDSVFFSINHLTNDTLRWDFKTRSTREFGTIRINVTSKTGNQPYLIQLLNEKEVVLDQKSIASPAKVRFDFLQPGKYIIKAISDKNRNKKWDTGDFHKKLQPEQVDYFTKIIEVRSNWDIEENWEF